MRAIIVAFLVTLVACASQDSPPVPLIGSEDDLVAFQGDWSGEYWSVSTQRSGSITFRLRPGEVRGSGDVIMQPPLDVQVDTQGTDRPVPYCTVLTIAYLTVSQGKISGELDPYCDPKSGTPLFTRFEGRLVDGDTIEGTFTSTTSLATPTGQWRVTRRRG